MTAPIPLRGESLVRVYRTRAGLRSPQTSLQAVDDVEIAVHAGQVHALVGLNGAGKSTLMRLLVGLIKPTAGHAQMLGVPAWRAPSAIRHRLGYVGTGRPPGALTVRQWLAAAARLHAITGAEADKRVATAIDDLALGAWADRRTKVLSEGNRRRVVIAAALLHRPDVLVLDEPTNGLDLSGVLELRRTISARAADGVAVLVSSHHLDEMARVADRITVVHDGRVVGALDPGGVDLERQFFDMVHAAQVSA